jgi:hypothetical protein
MTFYKIGNTDEAETGRHPPLFGFIISAKIIIFLELVSLNKNPLHGGPRRG